MDKRLMVLLAAVLGVMNICLADVPELVLKKTTATPVITYKKTPAVTASFTPFADASMTATIAQGDCLLTPCRTPSAAGQEIILSGTPEMTPIAGASVSATDTVASTATVTTTPTATATVTVTPHATPTITPRLKKAKGNVDIMVYPNPCGGCGEVTVRFCNPLPEGGKKALVKLYTTGYRLIRHEWICMTGRDSVTVPGEWFKPLSNAAYYMQVSVKDEEGRVDVTGVSTMLVLKKP